MCSYVCLYLCVVIYIDTKKNLKHLNIAYFEYTYI